MITFAQPMRMITLEKSTTSYFYYFPKNDLELFPIDQITRIQWAPLNVITDNVIIW